MGRREGFIYHLHTNSDHVGHLLPGNGSEFAGKMLDRWVYERGIRIDFSRPGTPTDNAMLESFNGRLRQECLNENWFVPLENARCKIEA